MAPPKKDFLNAAQRKELGRSLKDKLIKSFGLAFPGFVTQAVDAFLASTQPVNAKTLAELETRVKRGVVLLRSQAALPVNAPVEPDFASTPAATAAPVEVQEQTAEDSAEEIELYRQEIARQEVEIEVKRRRLGQTAMRAQLNEQVREKEDARVRKQAADASYASCEKQQIEAQKKRAAEIEQRTAVEKARLFAMQHQIIEERKQALEAERKIEREADKRMHDALREELSREKAEAAERVVQKRADINLLMQQNEEWKQARERQEEENRRREREIQQLADQLAQREDEHRSAMASARIEKIAGLLKAGEGTLKSIKTRKDEEEQRLKQYTKKQEDLFARRDELMHQKQSENKKLYKDYLMTQMADKENKRLTEDAQRLKQAAYWTVDSSFFAGVKRQLAEKSQQELLEYQATLNAQIAAKREKTAMSKQAEDPAHTKQSLKAQLEELRETKAVVDAQLRLFK